MPSSVGESTYITLKVRRETWRLLCRIREDTDYRTFDSIINEAIRKAHPHESSYI